jgi:hypothetical protein
MLKNKSSFQGTKEPVKIPRITRRKSNGAKKLEYDPKSFDTTLKAISSFVPNDLLTNLVSEEGAAMRPHSKRCLSTS